MTKNGISIGQLSRQTGCKVTTIRYFEQIGLLPEPRRSMRNTRIYDQSHLERLAFIRHCRELGFSQSSVRELLDLTDHPDKACTAVTEIASSHLAMINQRIARLSALKSELQHMIENCQGGQVAECRIVETLAAHSQLNHRTENH